MRILSTPQEITISREKTPKKHAPTDHFHDYQEEILLKNFLKAISEKITLKFLWNWKFSSWIRENGQPLHEKA